jgi:lipopolysaccharide/colanic/teichoic acid biosynthesis glycosyltransferase
MRHSVRPGITGWAQIKGLPLEEDAFLKLEYDLYYAKHQSLTLDVVILAQALKSALLPQKEPATPPA